MGAPVVVLVGLPGAGKSTVGRRLAARLGVEFRDSDELIVERAGRPIPAIFATVGEPAFRALEADVIVAALGEFDGVLALGGGAVVTAAVRAALADSGLPIVWLIAEHGQLLERVSGAEHRPLLAGDTAARLRQLADERDALYRQLATVTVDTSGRSVTDIVTELAGDTIASSRRDKTGDNR